MTDVVQKLEDMLERVDLFQRAIKKLSTASVSGTQLKEEAKSIHKAWLPILGELEKDPSISKERVQALSQNMDRLYALAKANSPKKSYINSLKTLRTVAEVDVLHTLIKRGGLKTLATSAGALFSSVTDPTLKTYLDEAVTCASNTCLRAAAVLSWCAVAHKIQHKLLVLGLPRLEGEFDKMRLDQGLLFKPFNRVYKFASNPDVEEVPDAHLILLSRFLGWIDDSQYKQLRGCLDFRNGCGHPGQYNPDPVKLQVYFADIVQLVLVNPTFS